MIRRWLAQDTWAHLATAAAIIAIFIARWRKTARISLVLVAFVIPHSL
jgi:hypothetical protein